MNSRMDINSRMNHGIITTLDISLQKPQQLFVVCYKHMNELFLKKLI